VLLASGTAVAASTERWIVDTAPQLLEGTGHGVAVTTDGRLEAVDVWRGGPVFEEPVVMAAATLPDGGLVVGTGHPARLYRVDGDRRDVLAEIPADQVTALLALPGGDVVVAAATPAALFRLRGGSLERLGGLDDGAIWDLALVGDTVVAAGGTPATLYRLAEGGLERWLELPDAHARCLLPVDDGVVVGTSGQGLVFRVTAAGVPALLVDSAFTEISDLVAAADGSLWATALVGEPVQPARRGGNSGGNGDGDDDAGGSTATATVELDLPKVNGSTATSEVVRLTPEGAVLGVHRFTSQVASALAADGDGVLVGTGFEGEIWRFVESGGARLATVDAVQVVAFADGGRAALTQGPGGVLRRATPERPATFRGPANSFPRPARIGRYEMSVAAGDARIRFRSGASAKPDDSWLPWSGWLDAPAGAVPVPPVASLQWELELGPGAAVEAVEVAYREVNLPPRFASVTVEDPGVVYLLAPPPSGPVLEAEHPDVSGIFAVLEDGDRRSKATKGKKFWRVGYRTVSWEVEDPNQDALRFEIEVEREDGFELPVRDRVESTQLAVDTTAVPDGRYRFRLRASDALSNPGGALVGTAVSEWFEVDNAPPEITIGRDGESWEVRVRDAGSAVQQVEYSRDGDRWHPLAPVDGVLDGPEERFRFPAEDGRHLVVVRAIDRHHNRSTASVVEE